MVRMPFLVTIFFVVCGYGTKSACARNPNMVGHYKFATYEYLYFTHMSNTHVHVDVQMFMHLLLQIDRQIAR